MISIEEIDKTILELEAHDTTYATIEKLAWLYTVKDHIKTTPANDMTTGRLKGNEFVELCSNVPIEPLLAIVGEHMEVIKTLYPKEYEVIIKRIKSL